MNHFQIKCPKCGGIKFWKTADSRSKCENCRYIFTPKSNPFKLSDEVLSNVMVEFLLEHSTNIILERVNISKYKLLKLLTLLRKLMTEDIPEVFEDEDIVKPVRHSLSNKGKLDKTQIGLEAIKQPVFGILRSEGKIYAEIIPNLEAKDLKSLLMKRSDIYPDTLRRYTGLAFKGHLYTLNQLKDEVIERKKYRINILQGFWGYLKRKLAAKGGVRKEKFPLYLGEYVWRYNHKKLCLKEQKKILLNLLSQYFEHSG